MIIDFYKRGTEGDLYSSFAFNNRVFHVFLEKSRELPFGTYDVKFINYNSPQQPNIFLNSIIKRNFQYILEEPIPSLFCRPIDRKKDRLVLIKGFRKCEGGILKSDVTYCGENKSLIVGRKNFFFNYIYYISNVKESQKYLRKGMVYIEEKRKKLYLTGLEDYLLFNLFDNVKSNINSFISNLSTNKVL